VGEFFRRALNDPSTDLRGASFPEAPPYPEGPGNIVQRIGDWIGNAAQDVGAFFGSIIRFIGERVFGVQPEDDQIYTPDDRPSRQPGDYRYASEETLDDDGWAEADSLTRAERDSTQLANILSRIRPRAEEPPVEDASPEEGDSDDES